MKFSILDQGIMVTQSQGLSANGKHDCKYYSNWQRSEPCFSDFQPAMGVNGLEKVKNFWDTVDWADCVVNFDCYDQDSISFIKSKYPNKSVFGSGSGVWIENDRWKLKQLVQKLGLPLQKSWRIIGVNKLREFLKEHPNVYIKTNLWRSDCESFHAKTLDFVEMRLRGLDVKYGAMSDTVEFIAEEMLDSEVEIGVDCFFSKTDYVPQCFLAYEIKKEWYLGLRTEVKNLPPKIKIWMEKLKPTLQSLDYRSGLSFEWKVMKDGTCYLLDICARLQSPASVGYPKWIKNWPEFVYKVGKGEKVSMDCPSKYVAAIFFESARGKDENVMVDIKDLNKVKPMCYSMNEGKIYSVKGAKTMAIPIAEGGTWQECVKNLKANAELCDADDLCKGNLETVDAIQEVIKNGNSLGITF
jgi:hypothetical protein